MSIGPSARTPDVQYERCYPAVVGARTVALPAHGAGSSSVSWLAACSPGTRTKLANRGSSPTCVSWIRDDAFPAVERCVNRELRSACSRTFATKLKDRGRFAGYRTALLRFTGQGPNL